MTADLLRTAAAKMRKRAEAAKDADHVGERWVAASGHDAANQGWRVDYAPEVDGFDSTLAQTPYDYEGSLATHLSGWHPAVARAVADSIDAALRWFDPDDATEAEVAMHDALLAVARAYLNP